MGKEVQYGISKTEMAHFISGQQQQNKRMKDCPLGARASSGMNIDRRRVNRDQKKREIPLNHDKGTATIDLRFDAADNDTVARGGGRTVFSFSSDAEPDCDVDVDVPVERSTSDDAVAASFAWRMSSVPDIDDGRRFVAGGDLTPGRPSVEEIDDTRV